MEGKEGMDSWWHIYQGTITTEKFSSSARTEWQMESAASLTASLGDRF